LMSRSASCRFQSIRRPLRSCR